MNDADCKDRQSQCRKDIYAAMFPRWAALLVISAFVAIAGVLFTLALLARAEAGEAKTGAAVQARDIEHLGTRLDRIEMGQEKITALLMEIKDQDKK